MSCQRAEPWVQEEGVSRFVSRKGAPHFCKDILVAIVVDVSEGYPMAFLQVAETARICHVRKSLTATVSKHDIGNQYVKAGSPSSQVEIQETVIIQIPEVGAHRAKSAVESGLRRIAGIRPADAQNTARRAVDVQWRY